MMNTYGLEFQNLDESNKPTITTMTTMATAWQFNNKLDMNEVGL